MDLFPGGNQGLSSLSKMTVSYRLMQIFSVERILKLLNGKQDFPVVQWLRNLPSKTKEHGLGPWVGELRFHMLRGT